MTRRKRCKAKPLPAHWEVARSGEANGRHFTKGDEITVRDHSGRKLRVRFVEWVTHPEAEWVTVSEIDPATGKGSKTRSFDPSRITTVHYKTKARTA